MSWMTEYLDELSELMNEWMNEWMNECLNDKYKRDLVNRHSKEHSASMLKQHVKVGVQPYYFSYSFD